MSQNVFSRKAHGLTFTFPSSQLCHWCGHRNENLKDLRIRKWDCPHCGHKGIDRDWNSAINIKVEGLRILGLA